MSARSDWRGFGDGCSADQARDSIAVHRGIFVLEAVSVMLQVASFKPRGTRIFKMAPLHHHFEQLGWAESKIIARFWISGLVLSLFALTTLKLR